MDIITYIAICFVIIWLTSMVIAVQEIKHTLRKGEKGTIVFTNLSMFFLVTALTWIASRIF